MGGAGFPLRQATKGRSCPSSARNELIAGRQPESTSLSPLQGSNEQEVQEVSKAEELPLPPRRLLRSLAAFQRLDL